MDNHGDVVRRWLKEPGSKDRDELFARFDGMVSEVSDGLPSGQYKVTYTSSITLIVK